MPSPLMSPAALTMPPLPDGSPPGAPPDGLKPCGGRPGGEVDVADAAFLAVDDVPLAGPILAGGVGQRRANDDVFDAVAIDVAGTAD